MPSPLACLLHSLWSDVHPRPPTETALFRSAVTSRVSGLFLMLILLHHPEALVCAPPVPPRIRSIPWLLRTATASHWPLNLPIPQSLLFISLLPPPHHLQSLIFNHPSPPGDAWRSTSSLRLGTLEWSLVSYPVLPGPHIPWVPQCVRRSHLAFTAMAPFPDTVISYVDCVCPLIVFPESGLSPRVSSLSPTRNTFLEHTSSHNASSLKILSLPFLIAWQLNLLVLLRITFTNKMPIALFNTLLLIFN